MNGGYIERSAELPASMNYDGLREQGIAHIQSLCGDIWTDHNAHDPGITSLETLIYAITDLSYRTNHPIEDLLVDESSSSLPASESGMFEAHEILTTAPTIITDLRILLLKINGIRNAWFQPVSTNDSGEYEPRIWFDKSQQNLTLDNQERPNDFLPIHISGLYKVLLELEIDLELGSLNEFGITQSTVDRGGTLNGLTISVKPTSANIVKLLEKRRGDFHQVAPDSIHIEQQSNQHFVVQARIDVGQARADMSIDILIHEPVSNISTQTIRNWLRDDETTPLRLLWNKYQRIRKIVNLANCALQANRGLTEDFVSIAPVPLDPIGVCVDLDLVNDADIDQIQAAIIVAIETYFNPPATLKSLTDLLARGDPVTEIFSGPYIDKTLRCEEENALVFEKPGFVDLRTLNQTQLRTEIRTSDLIALLMSIPGVNAVRNVVLRKADSSSDRWCLAVEPSHQPVFDLAVSSVCLFKDGFPFRTGRAEVERTVAEFRGSSARASLVLGPETLTLPRGRYRNTGQFYSIQNDFPQVYGIGEVGLPKHASEQRKTQAKQFKAYLALFDQLLADYLQQLAHLPQLLSLDENLQRTFFPGSLAQAPSLGEEPFLKQYFLDSDAITEGRGLLENREDYVANRNQALDHLIARFAESFVDYALVNQNISQNPYVAKQQLIQTKVAFAKDYPTLSRRRGQGFNQHAAAWDNTNVSGLEHRIARILGLRHGDDPAHQRRDLACDEVRAKLFRPRKVNNQRRLEIKAADNQLLFKSKQLFNPAQIPNAIEVYYDSLFNPNLLVTEKLGNDGWTWKILAQAQPDLSNDQVFPNERDALSNMFSVLRRHDELLAEFCRDEGLHLIEHCLLRPKADGAPLMTPCLGDAEEFCAECGDTDPYSHRISVYCPAWPERFKQIAFRHFFETSIRSEAPAHVHVRICWISNRDMRRLDQAYQQWLQPAASTAQANQRAAQLIQVMQSVNTIYPPAVLHDVNDESPVGVPMRLDETPLGQFDLTLAKDDPNE